MSEAITKALDDFEIQAITTAYEQGFGHAWRTELSNPYPDGTTARTAWQYGRDAGQRQTPQPAPSPQPAVPDGGDFFVLDDEAKAMIVNSHHYTPGNIQALIEQLTAFSDPTKTTQADWDNLDWRGFCNVIQRVMMGLACDLQPAAADGITAKAEDAHQPTKEAKKP